MALRRSWAPRKRPLTSVPASLASISEQMASLKAALSEKDQQNAAAEEALNVLRAQLTEARNSLAASKGEPPPTPMTKSAPSSISVLISRSASLPFAISI